MTNNNNMNTKIDALLNDTMKLQRGMMIIDDKNVCTEGNLTGEYVHTDEDRVTVPSSRVNNDARMPPLKSYRGGETS